MLRLIKNVTSILICTNGADHVIMPHFRFSFELDQAYANVYSSENIYSLISLETDLSVNFIDKNYCVNDDQTSFLIPESKCSCYYENSVYHIVRPVELSIQFLNRNNFSTNFCQFALRDSS